MVQVPLAEAKAKFSAMVERALQGETVEITRRGKPVVKLVASEQERPPIDVEALRRAVAAMEGPVVDTEDFWREYRAGDRY